MLLFPACCHILLYLGVGVGCLSWSEAWGASDLKMDLDTSSAQIAHKSCSTHAVFMLLNTRHKSRLGYWTGTLFFFFFWVCSWQMSRLYLSFIPEPALPSPCVIESMDAVTQGVTPLDGSQLLSLQLWGLHLWDFCLPRLRGESSA